MDVDPYLGDNQCNGYTQAEHGFSPVQGGSEERAHIPGAADLDRQQIQED